MTLNRGLTFAGDNTLDRHHSQLRHWAEDQSVRVLKLPEIDGGGFSCDWTKVAGDASQRCYYRLTNGEKSAIVMDSANDLGSVVEFARIAGIFQQGGVRGGIRSGIRVPQIYAADFDKGFLLLEDFGDQMLKAQLHLASGDSLFEKILPVLLVLAACDSTGLAFYSKEKLESELMLFDEWYLQQNRQYFLSAEEREIWNRLKALLLESALEQPQVVVHRDFHSCNLHQLANEEIGVIDFQDAVCGPVTYDLVSWLWDRYISWPREAIVKWIELARAEFTPVIQKNISAEQWLCYCDFMGLQRNIKIVGIFSRLHYRDKKQGYLEMIPQFNGYIRDIISRYSELGFARSSMDKWLG